jgi:general secretion pathway protein J
MMDRRRDSGFSLLEILVALTVLGFLLIGLHQGARTALDLWKMQSRQLSGTAEFNSTVRLLRTLLTDVPRNPAAPMNSGGPPPAITFEGTTDHLTFVGDLPNGLGHLLRADMTLRLERARLVLAWKPHQHQVESVIPAITEIELLGGFSRLEFAYWGALGPELPPGWMTEWAGPAIPELLRIRIRGAAVGTRSWPDLIIAPQLATLWADSH